MNPEDYDPILDQQLEWLKMFETASVDHPIFDKLHKAMIDGDKDALFEMYKDPNLLLMYQSIMWVDQFDKEEKYKKSFINLLKIILILYATNGYARSRIGWWIWCMVCGANPNSHYPLTWEGCMEPREWYDAGERQRKGTKDDYRINSESGGFAIPD